MGLMAMTVLPLPNTAPVYEAYLTGGRSGGAGTSIIHASLHVCEGEIVCLCESVCSQTTPARDGFRIPTSIYLNKREREIEISVKSTQLKYKNKGLKLKLYEHDLHIHIRCCGAGWQYCEQDNTVVMAKKRSLAKPYVLFKATG